MQAPVMVLSKCFSVWLPVSSSCRQCFGVFDVCVPAWLSACLLLPDHASIDLSTTTHMDRPNGRPTDANTKRETGRTAQLGNIAAAKVSQ